MFHITTNAKDDAAWLTLLGIPQALVDNLSMTRNIQGAKLYAFCILPDHLHIILSPGKKGLSTFMHSFKKNSSRDITSLLGRSGFRTAAARILTRSGDSKIAAPGERPLFTGWQKGYYDERIRDGQQCGAALAYVQGNAIHHHLMDDITE